MKKTVMIWDQLDGELQYAVLDGDYTHLDGVYIGSCDDSSKEDELNGLKYELTDKFPVQAVKDGAAVISCGFIF